MNKADMKMRKRIRRKRAAIHKAMDEANRLRKARKKGRSCLDQLMRAQGYQRIAPDGMGLPPEMKFTELT